MSVRTDALGQVHVLTLARPKQLNSFDRETAVQLHDALERSLADDEVRALVLTGEGDRAFCTGADIGQFQRALESGTAPEVVAEVSGTMNRVISAIVRAPKPVVAAVNGVAAGGGLGLALACDVRIAAQTARFLTAFMNVAVAPDGGTTWLLPRIVGWARARELLLLNPVLDAKTALEWGLVTEIVPSSEVVKRATDVAQGLAKNPVRAMGWTKDRLAAALDLDKHLEFERKATIASAETQDFAEGIRAFFQKRKPQFK